tara:strand:+ start:4586 stop:5416 length:831 start_codon:yes stop_codon:yes gene_type:complete
MRPLFTVFADDTKLIINMRVGGWEPLVNLVKGNDEYWMRQHFKDVPHRLFRDGEVYQIAEYDMESPPACSIEFNLDEDVSVAQWVEIEKFVTDWILKGKGLEDWKACQANTPSFMQEKAPAQLGTDELWSVFDDKITMDANEDGVVRKQDKMSDDYTFKMQQDGDVMFYEVTKPFTAVPYSTYVEDFDRKGHYPFFTNLYVNTSWGLGHDNKFITELWTHHFKMGPCDLEKMVKERVARCVAGLEGEPCVYRMDLEACIASRSRKEALKRKRVSFK